MSWIDELFSGLIEGQAVEKFGPDWRQKRAQTEAQTRGADAETLLRGVQTRGAEAGITTEGLQQDQIRQALEANLPQGQRAASDASARYSTVNADKVVAGTLKPEDYRREFEGGLDREAAQAERDRAAARREGKEANAIGVTLTRWDPEKRRVVTLDKRTGLEVLTPGGQPYSAPPTAAQQESVAQVQEALNAARTLEGLYSGDKLHQGWTGAASKAVKNVPLLGGIMNSPEDLIADTTGTSAMLQRVYSMSGKQISQNEIKLIEGIMPDRSQQPDVAKTNATLFRQVMERVDRRWQKVLNGELPNIEADPMESWLAQPGTPAGGAPVSSGGGGGEQTRVGPDGRTYRKVPGGWQAQ